MSCKACGFDAAAVIAASWEFFVPLPAVSQNKLGSNKGSNRFYYASLRRDYEIAVMAESRQKRMPRAKVKRRITFVRHYHPDKENVFDHGNLVGGMKPLLDACVRQGLLVQDSPAWCEDHYHQVPHDVVGISVLVEEFA